MTMHFDISVLFLSFSAVVVMSNVFSDVDVLRICMYMNFYIV